MTFRAFSAFSLLFLAAAAIAPAQQHFPLRPGEWEVTTTVAGGQNSPKFLFCLNDAMWTKALTQNPSCSILQLSVTRSGMSYNLDCPGKTFQMKGSVSNSFDGMTHMTGKGSFDITANGKATHSDSQVDYRWKQEACSATDMNMRQRSAH